MKGGKIRICKKLSMNGSEEKLKFLLANAHLLAIQWGGGERYLKKGRHQHLPDEIQPKTETFLKVQGN